MKTRFSISRAFAILCFAALVFLGTSCHHYYPEYYASGYGYGSVHASVRYYDYGGTRYSCGSGPWYRNGIYHGPVRYYTVSGRRYTHGHGPWYNNGRYLVVNDRGPTVVRTPPRVVRTPATVVRTPINAAPVRRAAPGFFSGGHPLPPPHSSGHGRGSRRGSFH